MKPNVSHKSFCQSLFLALKTAMIHERSNQTFKSAFNMFWGQFKQAMTAEEGLRLEVAMDHLFVNGQKIRTDIPFFATYEYFAALFSQRQIGGLVFLESCTEEELDRFVFYLARLPASSHISYESVSRDLQDQQITHIHALPLLERKTAADQPDEAQRATQLKRRALKSYVRAMNVMKHSAQHKEEGQQGMRKAKRMVYNMVDVCLEEGFSFLGLANVKNYDEYTFNHSINVCVISIAFGKHLGLNKRQLAELGIAAMFHDYGKTEIPREILNKPGKFEPAEWEIMKSHPLQSVKKLLEMSQFSLQDIKKIIAAFEHHRNYDRTGYPNTGMDKPMNFFSKVVSIADAYDAMTTNRVYQRAMLASTALKILADNAGTKFDPVLVKAFIQTVGIYPVGSLFKTQEGKLGVVVQTHKDPAKLARPIIQYLRQETNGLQLAPELIDLSEEPHAAVEIASMVHPEDVGVNVSNLLFADVAAELATGGGATTPAGARS